MKQFVIVVERDDLEPNLKGWPEYAVVIAGRRISYTSVLPYRAPDEGYILQMSQLAIALQMLKRRHPTAFIAAYDVDTFDPRAVHLRWEKERRWPNGELRLSPEIEACRRLHSDIETILGREA
jgi:hypothetical protein